jgi:SAM-dependent methyltransferase
VSYTQLAPYYDAVYRAIGKDYAEEAATIRDLVRERAPDARSLLDVACGTGMHLEHLRRWFEVAGVDASADMLVWAKARLPGVELQVADMLDFDAGRRFDAVTCLFSSVAYMLTLDGLEAAVRNMARHLEPGGVLLIEPWLDPALWRPGSLHALLVNEPELKVARLSVSDVDGPIARTDMHYLVATPLEGVQYFTEPHELRLYYREEYIGALEAAGLAVEHLEDAGLSGRGLYIGVNAD